MSRETFEKLPADRREHILSAGIREFSRKTYADASTDSITEACGISKGLLFHYFGSKRAYYLCCLEKSLERLTEETEPVPGDDFYGIIFESMDRKISVCRRYWDETHMVNMASRDASREIAGQKEALLGKYAARIDSESETTLGNALLALGLVKEENRIAAEGLRIYVGAVVNRYLRAYQQDPDGFFARSGEIKKEMREYLDLMLYGICQRRTP